jgi:hypothetical protein
MEPSSDDPLIFDVRRDIVRIDPVMSQILADASLADEFVQDPNVVLSRLGLHPETTRDVHDRVNQVFYAVLTNVELLEHVRQHYSTFDSRDEVNLPVLEAALQRGEVENSVECDVAAVEHGVTPDFLRRAYSLTLNDLNTRDLLSETYSPEEIDRYVDSLVQAIVDRRPLSEHPVLESWDENYGVGKEYGVGFFEVAPGITIATPVEAFNYVTAYNHTYAYTHELEEVAERALGGDSGASRHLATAGAMMRLVGEVLAHAQTLGRPQ